MQREELIHECKVFTRYLLHRPPSPYIIDRYCDYHAVTSDMSADENTFDRVLTQFAVRHSLCVKIADVYASRVCRNALLRRKLVLLLALAEVTPPFFYDIDNPHRLARPLIFAKLATEGLAYAAALAIGIIVLGPLHAVRANARPRPESVP
jgi:hypothetical protein